MSSRLTGRNKSRSKDIIGPPFSRESISAAKKSVNWTDLSCLSDFHIIWIHSEKYNYSKAKQQSLQDTSDESIACPPARSSDCLVWLEKQNSRLLHQAVWEAVNSS